MPKYIDAVTTAEAISEKLGISLGDLVDIFAEIPSADVVEAVRCKDCIHYGGITYGFVCKKFSGIDTKICMHADGFCSYGERKGQSAEDVRKEIEVLT